MYRYGWPSAVSGGERAATKYRGQVADGPGGKTQVGVDAVGGCGGWMDGARIERSTVGTGQPTLATTTTTCGGRTDGDERWLRSAARGIECIALHACNQLHYKRSGDEADRSTEPVDDPGGGPATGPRRWWLRGCEAPGGGH